MEKILCIKIIQTGDSLPENENIFLFSNHQSMSDIPAIISVACRKSSQQNLKWFVKDPIKWIPGIGWGMLFLDCIFVKRNWAADKEKIFKTFQSLRENETAFWLVSFLEGTRITPAKRNRSQSYASKNSLPKLNHVLLPRAKGFEATLDGLGDKIEALYDTTIGYENKAPGLYSLFFTKINKIHVHIDRISEIPKKEDRANWLLERYVLKDQRMERFYKTGFFL